MQSLIYWMRNFKFVKSHDKYKLTLEPNIILRKEWDRKRARVKNDAWNSLSRRKIFEKQTNKKKKSNKKAQKNTGNFYGINVLAIWFTRAHTAQYKLEISDFFCVIVRSTSRTQVFWKKW